MPPPSDAAKRLSEINKPNPLRSLLRIVNDTARQNAETPAPLPMEKSPPLQPNVDFEEVSRLLQMAKTTLQEEHQRMLGLKDKLSKLRGYKDAYIKNQETIEELRADRDMWRRQAVAMSNCLLDPQQPI